MSTEKLKQIKYINNIIIFYFVITFSDIQRILFIIYFDQESNNK